MPTIFAVAIGVDPMGQAIALTTRTQAQLGGTSGKPPVALSAIVVMTSAIIIVISIILAPMVKARQMIIVSRAASGLATPLFSGVVSFRVLVFFFLLRPTLLMRMRQLAQPPFGLWSVVDGPWF